MASNYESRVGCIIAAGYSPTAGSLGVSMAVWGFLLVEAAQQVSGQP